MYRLGIEAILGVTRVGDALNINPCIPRDWPGYTLDYRFGTTHYKVSVENPGNINQGVLQVILDEKLLIGKLIPLINDGFPHEVRIVMKQSLSKDVQ